MSRNPSRAPGILTIVLVVGIALPLKLEAQEPQDQSCPPDDPACIEYMLDRLPDVMAPHVLLNAAEKALAQGKPDEAERLVRRGLDASPNNSVRGKLNEILIQLGIPIDCSRCPIDDDQFVLIPAGSFQMGSETGDSDEAPVHTVSITKPFYMQKTEVTRGQWRSVMGSLRGTTPPCEDDCAVRNVAWVEALAFVVKLNEEFPIPVYRLPTKAEWEYAARAGTTGDFGGTGNPEEMGRYRCHDRTSVLDSTTHQVAQKRPNAWGLYDMHGNVAEWVSDLYSSTYYRSSPSSDPRGPTSGSRRVLRGGSCYESAEVARSANRVEAPSKRRYRHVGFRLAKTAPIN